MKFIPLRALESLNALLCGVEAHGLLLTVRVEAFSTRKSREEKALEATLSERHGSSSASSTAPAATSMGPGGGASGGAPSFGDIVVSPGGDDISSSVPSSSGGGGGGGGGGGHFPPMLPSGAFAGLPTGASPPHQPHHQGVDERLVLLIAALNAIHGQCDYDFSVLSEDDFRMCEPQEVFDAVNQNLEGVVGQPFGNGTNFWLAVASALAPEQQQQQHQHQHQHQQQQQQSPNPFLPPIGFGSSVLDVLTSGACEYFQFCSPQCDPLAHGTIWSAHYFILCKRQRLLISIVCFGEGNQYRGEDAASPSANESPVSRIVGAFPSDPRDDWYSTDKNRDFYGF